MPKMGRSPDRKRRITSDFAGWLGHVSVPPQGFFRHGMIVLDANVLLDLYRITPDARRQVLETLRDVADRLWVPHQAALEFSRNRKEAVRDRTSSLKRAQQMLRTATTDAVSVLESAVEQLVEQRERSGTTRDWDIAAVGLDKESMLARFAGLMDPALAELEALAAEHDLHPEQMQRVDPCSNTSMKC